jgi:purine-binding chemotaxis protein CheW
MAKTMDKRDILKQRAIANSITEERNTEEITNPLYLLSFTLLSNHYAFETKNISEVLHIKAITRVPGTPDTIEGVINLRGSIVPVINTRELFSVGTKGLTEQNRLIILSGKEIDLGIICDSINGIITTDLSNIAPVPANLTKSLESYAKGVIQNNTLLLDSVKILTSPKILIDK